MTTPNQTKWNSLGDFLKAKDAKEKGEQSSSADPQTSTPVTPVTPVTDVLPVTRVKDEAAPSRDFTRVANSVVRDAIPAGIFTGKCKQLYDYLYSRTRGAIVPTRSARIPTDLVMRGAGMTRHTYRAHIHRLISFGLIEIEEKPGEHGGNVYTVYLPEEVEANRGDSRHKSDKGDRGHTGDKVPGVQGSQAHPGDRGLSAINTEAYGDSKTLIKTNTEQSDDDDAAALAFIRPLQQAIRAITGRELTAGDVQGFKELGDIIATEFQIAAARTTVNVPGPFIATHIRRRLFKKEKSQMVEEILGEIPSPSSTPPLSSAEIAKCSDCGGSGWWYPQGETRGVARCKHEKLTIKS